MRVLLFFSVGIFAVLVCSCNPGNKPAEEMLPGDVVTNPNTASGRGTKNDLPVLTFEEYEHDFGKIIEGETVSYSFHFTNTGKTDLVIADVSTGCGCAVPSFPKTSIRPGHGGIVKVTFDSRNRRGFQTKSILVVANTQPNVVHLKIKAQVVAPGAE